MKIKHLIILFLTIIIAYSSVAFFLHPLKYDFFDQFYPWRYFAGECFHNGALPWWMPYQLGGYPIYANPQSSILYPVTWVTGIIFGYSIAILHIEFILHILLGGIGMYFLADFFLKNKRIALFLAIAYSLSGFFVGNAQHYSYIISATWIPFVLWSYLKVLRYGKIKHALETSLYLTLLITGGYSAYPVIIFYLLGILSAIYIIRKLLNKNKSLSLRSMKLLAIVAVVTVLMCFGYLYSVYHAAEYITRGNGLSLDVALSHAFSPKAFISFFLPLATTANYMYYFHADMSMINAYIGLIALMFLVWSFIHVKERNFRIILLLSVLAALFALGRTGGLRAFTYHYLPLMNLFRFPSVFRLFFIIGLLLCSGYGIKEFLKEHSNKPLLYISLGFSLFFLLILVFISVKYHPVLTGLKPPGTASTIFDRIAYQSVIQLVICLAVFLILLFVRQRKQMLITLFAIALLDLIISVKLNAGYTIMYSEFKFSEIRQYEKNLPKGFSAESVLPIKENRSENYSMKSYWKNLALFHKQIAFDGYDPFIINSFATVYDNPALFAMAESQMPVYFTARILPYDSLPSATDTSFHYKEATAYVNEPDYLRLSKQIITDDTTVVIDYKKFEPDKFIVDVKTKENGILVFNQNNYPGWKVYIDDDPTRVIPVNISFMGIYLPAGSHTVSFVFKPAGAEQPIIFFSLALFFLTGLFLIFKNPVKKLMC